MDTRLLRFYTDHMRRFGTNDPRALGWRDLTSQMSRFEVLVQVGDLSGATILDEGCGFGDLYPFLRERFTDIRYTGVDVNPEAIATARERFPEAEFVTSDFTNYEGGPFDYVLSSGALTFRIDDYENVYRAHIRKMFELCTKGVAFNVLDRNGITETMDYVGYDQQELLAYCRTFVPKAELRNDYSPEDFTIFLYH